MKDISKRIKELREERGITQSALAEKLCVTRQAVSNWETKKTRPDVETLEKIAKAFGIELADLLCGAARREPNKRYIFATAVFAVVIVLSLLLNIFAVPVARDMFTYSHSSRLFFLMAAIRLGFYGCLFPFILSLISVWADISIRKPLIRKILLAIGIVMLAVYLYGAFGTALNVFCGETGLNWLSNSIIGLSYDVHMSFSRHPPVSIIYGALIFLGINKKAAINR